MKVSVITGSVLCAALVHLASPASAQTDPYYFGVGIQSCASWTPGKEAEVEGWIFGFWSATNLAETIRKDVGSHTDGAGIIAEVNRVCLSDPSMSINKATVKAFNKILISGR